MNDESQFENPIDGVAEEFVARYRRGEHPSLTEYIQRFPALADEIRELFPTLVLMEQARPSENPKLPQAVLLDNFDKPPERFNEYRIIREIGRGGMGIVYEAVQESLGRQVALKVLPHTGISKTTQAERFKREAQAAARLNHPNIVPVFGVGEQNGSLYYAMQLIRGLGLDQVASEVKQLRQSKKPPQKLVNADATHLLPVTAETSLSSVKELAQVLVTGVETNEMGQGQASNGIGHTGHAHSDSDSSKLMLKSKSGPNDSHAYWKSVAKIGEQVALALQYAADEGVLHRDIKPANLLLDLQGKVWVTDFGLATDLSKDCLTETGDIIGTIRYMAPERLRGISSPLVDVYSLGATLYELVTLEPLFGQLPREQIMHAVSTVVPRRPRVINAEIPQDLETIILKALAKEPRERYENAKSLADDLRCFLENKPIKARRTQPIDLVWKWCRRNPAVASLLTVSSILLVMLSIGIWISSLIRRERDEAVHQRELAELAQTTSNQLLVRTSQAEKEARVREHLAKAVAMQQSGREGQRFQSLDEIRQAALLQPSAELQRELVDNAIATFALTDIKTEEEFKTTINARACFNHQGTRFVQIQSHEATNQGKQIVPSRRDSVYSDFSLLVRNSSDWNQVTRYPGPGFACYFAFAEFSYNDKYLYVTYLREAEPDVLYCYDASTFEKIHSTEIHTKDFEPNLAQQPKGSWIAYQTPDSVLIVYDIEKRKEVTRQKLDYLTMDLSFKPTGEELAATPQDGSAIYFLDTLTLQEKSRLLTGDMSAPAKLSLCWSSDGELLASARDDGSIEVWNVPQRRICSILRGHVGLITSLDFSRRGYLLRSVSWDASSRLWDASMGEELLVSERELLSFTADDRIYFTTRAGLSAGVASVIHHDPIQRLHDSAEGNSPFGRRNNGIRWATFSPDDQIVLVSGESFIDGWEVSTGRKLSRINIPGCKRILFEPEGHYFLTLLSDRLLLWPVVRTTLPDSQQIHCGPPVEVDLGLRHDAPNDLNEARWIPNSQRLAVFDVNSSQVILRDMTNPAHPDPTIVRLPSLHPNVSILSISPDGKWLAAGAHHAATVQVWNLDNYQRRTVVPQPGNPTPSFSVGFTPDSRSLIVSCSYEVLDGGHKLFDIESLQQKRMWNMNLSPGLPIFFSSQNRLVTASGPNEVQIIETDGGKVLSKFRVNSARFNIPISMLNGDRQLAMISGFDASDILIWDLAKIQQLLDSLGLKWDLDIPKPSIPPVPQVSTFAFDDGGLAESMRLQQVDRDNLYKAENLAVIGRKAECLRIVGTIRNLTISDARLLNNIAWYLGASKDSPNEATRVALKLAKQAVQNAPMDSTYWNTLGTILYRDGEYHESIRAFSTSEALEPQTFLFENATFLAMCNWQIGEPELAQKWFKVAEDIYQATSTPDNENSQIRAEALELLH
jgi:eukaryotic-like serine/threonine-protein kinase